MVNIETTESDIPGVLKVVAKQKMQKISGKTDSEVFCVFFVPGSTSRHPFQ